MTTYLLDLLILAIILITLYVFSKGTDERLTVFEKDIEEIKYQVGLKDKVVQSQAFELKDPQYEPLRKSLKKEPTFKSKINTEEERMSKLMQDNAMQKGFNQRCYKCKGPFQDHHKINIEKERFYHTKCLPGKKSK